MRTFLFSLFDHDLYGVVQRGGSDEELAAFTEKTVSQKEANHHINDQVGDQCCIIDTENAKPAVSC
jgi:hypothetical protein